ncbi:MAG: CoA transferase, partial [Pseudomonadota bacterium]
MLEPYTVLDFTDHRGELGPMLLGDLGADVIRVEPPGGSPSRGLPPLAETSAPSLRSLSFQAFNRNKRSIELDFASTSDQQILDQLVARADIIFVSDPTDAGLHGGIDFARARALNSQIIYVSMTAFGKDGPYADFAATDLTIAALGGPVALQGVPGEEPVRLSVPQVWRHAGAEAAAAALLAHQRMLRTGTAQEVDVSAQAVMTWTMLNAMDAHAIQGFDFQRMGHRAPMGPNGMDVVHPTADGYILALPMSSVLAGCTEWMISDGVADVSLRDIDWMAFDLGIADPDTKPLNLAQATALLQQFCARHTKQELFEFGLQHNITLAPVNTLSGLLELEHLRDRDYWLRHGDSPVCYPGLWAKCEQAPLSVRSAPPALNADGAQIRAELESTASDVHMAQNRPAPQPDLLPFAGLKVVDFAWVGVGPISSKFLADHGAEVIRIESESRPDVLRGNGPFKDNVPGINRSQFFGDFNTSKQSLALDMKQPQAREIVQQLIAEADVVIESFAPGAIERMGLGYAQIKAWNPQIIMLSTCLMGQTGPAAQLAGYGYHAAALAGFYELTGWPDMSPMGPWVAYTDTIAPRFVSALLTAAIDHRRRTGEGCFLDVAQLETALHFLGPEILDLQVNGHLARRMGNRSAYAAPQGCYRCAGEDNWCAIAVASDNHWQQLLSVLDEGYPEHALHQPELATAAGRLADHERIDKVLRAWTAGCSADEIMAALQTVGVPAGKVQRSSDLLADHQYQHRQFYRYLDHPEMGHIPYAG